MTSFPIDPAAPVRAPQQRRSLSPIRTTDVLALLGAIGAAVATTAGLTSVLPIAGPYAWVALVFALFLLFYATLVAFDEDGPAVRARLAAAVIHLLAFVLLTVLVLVVSYTLVRGFSAMRHWNFYTQDMGKAGPLDPLSVGGIRHAAIGTLEQIAIALAITVPLGLLCAVFLSEFPGRFARFVRTIVEAMTALPSIVAGLFIYALWIIALGHEKSGYAAAFALGVMMLPIIIRAADVVLRLVPGQLKEASYAMGASRWRTVWHVVLPTARSGLTTAVILGAARGIGETSPVLLTAGFNTVTNANPAKGPQVSLPLQAFMAVKSPQDTMIVRGFGAAAFLLLLVLVLFVVARLLGGRGPGHLSKRQRRAIARRSRRDAQRFAARAAVLLAAVGLISVVTLHPDGPAAADDSYVPISGAGSTWSSNAINQWQKNVLKYGMQVNYNASGSSDGRNQFKNGTVDFAVSEIPYGLTDAGVKDLPPTRKYAYMPIVAGGTSFMYNLHIGGQRVTNLRLSGENLARIFTGNAKMWNDAKIAKDNPGLRLPARPIVPVVRSDGSGTTAQLTLWMSKKYPTLWNAYCKKAGRPSNPCGMTSNFPVVSGSGFTAQAQSLGVAGYVAQDHNEGTITYVEYSYARNASRPVAKVLNKKGYYVEPTAENVAVGLLAAKINTTPSSPDYLTQILDGVYDNPDARAYPLSSYSYMVVPTDASGSFTEDKGKTLGAFAYYFLCEGQQKADSLGYSPLPKNLVQAGFDQIRRIPGVVTQSIDLAKCHNPTFSASGENVLAKNAPFPPACDKAGPSQCTTGTGGAKAPTANSGGGATAAGGTATTPGAIGTGSVAAPGAGALPGTIDPDTGQAVAAADTGTATEVVAGTPQNLGATYSTSTQVALMLVAGLALLLVVLAPPLVALLARRRAS
jgi:phosphate ABC transporter permease subunit PstA/phosphate ABC transporter phosphate-binding protein